MIWNTICDMDSTYLTIMIDNKIIAEVNLDNEYLMYYDADSHLIHAIKNLGSFADLSIPVPADANVPREGDDGGPSTYAYNLDGVTYIWTI